MKYGPKAIAKAKAMYQAHLDAPLMPAERTDIDKLTIQDFQEVLERDLDEDELGAIVDALPAFQILADSIIWATDFDLACESFIANENTFLQLFKNIGAEHIYHEMDKANRIAQVANLPKDEATQDWIFENLPFSLIEFYTDNGY